jgi:23S rRNA (guanosine2251-2'-O)-methyltransferase
MSEDEFFNSTDFQNESLIVALDHVQDPHNLGAIARSASFFGVKTLLIPKARQVSLTKASVATSQGAFAYLNVVQVSNLTRAIKKLKDEQFWALGADMNGESVEEVVGFYEKTVLILGNEAKGLSRLVKENCDRVVSIGREIGELESLNVSVAAGILIYRLSK